MPRNLRIALLSAIPVAALLLPVFVYAVDRAVSRGEVPGNVSAAGVELGGLGRDDAIAALLEYEGGLAAEPLVYTIDDLRFALDPEEIGLDIDEESIVDTAFEQRKTGFFDGFFAWLGGFNDTISLQVEVGYDSAALDEVLDGWEASAIAEPAFQGNVTIANGRALPDYPRSGEALERASAHRATRQEIQHADRREIRLNTEVVLPLLTEADVDAAVEEANLLLASPITLVAEDPAFELTLTTDELVGAFVTDVRTNSPTSIEVGFDRGAIAAMIAPHRDELEQPPRDARFELTADDTVEFFPGRSETVVDVDLLLEAVEEIARTESKTGELPLAEGRPAGFTNEAAQAMMPITRVARFTTRHDAGEPRVRNIHTIADAVAGAMVWPGEIFSLNQHVGPRTTEKGYVPAPMIQGGRLIDSIGGGVSQFATTFYNAVFYGCYEDIEHKPHSFYISRYPEVNEATISWPDPDLKFRNNSDAIIIIDTSYTASSITVAFYGNNGGCEVTRELGNRTGFVSPKDEFEGNAALDPGQQRTTTSGITGFTNTVKRIMTYPDGTVIEQEWDWRYRARDRIIEVHPCMLPNSEEECPLQVPGVVGQAQGAAVAALQNAGFAVSVGQVNVTDPGQDGLVQSQSVAPGEFLAAGSTVTIQVGVFVPPPPPPPPDE